MSALKAEALVREFQYNGDLLPKIRTRPSSKDGSRTLAVSRTDPPLPIPIPSQTGELTKTRTPPTDFKV